MYEWTRNRHFNNRFMCFLTKLVAIVPRNFGQRSPKARWKPTQHNRGRCISKITWWSVSTGVRLPEVTNSRRVRPRNNDAIQKTFGKGEIWSASWLAESWIFLDQFYVAVFFPIMFSVARIVCTRSTPDKSVNANKSVVHVFGHRTCLGGLRWIHPSPSSLPKLNQPNKSNVFWFRME